MNHEDYLKEIDAYVKEWEQYGDTTVTRYLRYLLGRLEAAERTAKALAKVKGWKGTGEAE